MNADPTEVASVTAPVTVRPFRPGDAQRWERHVLACPAATFFHRIGWRDILEEELRHRTHYLVAERGDDIVGVLPLAEVRSVLFGHALVSLPLAVYAGPAADDEGTARALIEAAGQLGRELSVQHVEMRHRWPHRPDWTPQSLYVSFRKRLAVDEDANLKAIPRKQRAMIRKAIERGLIGERDAHMARFFALYADNMHRHGSPGLARRYFDRLLATFGEDCEVLTVLDRGGTPVSGVVSFRFRDQILPYYAGDTEAARALAANDFKYWELMRSACRRGIAVFDYGRSKEGTGSYDFKRNWGFEPERLHYEFALLSRDAVPQNNPLNPKYRAAIALWRRLPRPLVDAIGPHLARHLN